MGNHNGTYEISLEEEEEEMVIDIHGEKYISEYLFHKSQHVNVKHLSALSTTKQMPTPPQGVVF